MKCCLMLFASCVFVYFVGFVCGCVLVCGLAYGFACKIIQRGERMKLEASQRGWGGGVAAFGAPKPLWHPLIGLGV